MRENFRNTNTEEPNQKITLSLLEKIIISFPALALTTFTAIYGREAVNLKSFAMTTGATLFLAGCFYIERKYL